MRDLRVSHRHLIVAREPVMVDGARVRSLDSRLSGELVYRMLDVK